MIGYILNINKVRDEDIIVSILTQKQFITVYRFYGARHSKIQLGFKIDFELESNLKFSIARLKDTLHIGFPWLFDKNIRFIWQSFCILLNKHLKDIDTLDSFYFELLNDISTKIAKQNPKRVIVEAYITLLKHEGRLHEDLVCVNCHNQIQDDLILTRSFVPFHLACIPIQKQTFNIKNFIFLCTSKSTLYLNDQEVDTLYKILEEGL